MAGFTIDIGDKGVAIESAVQAAPVPSATAIGSAAKSLENLGRGIFGVLDAQARANKTSEAGVSRKMYADLSKSLDGLKGSDVLQTRTGVQSALTAYANSGGKIDSSVSDLVKLKTGIDISYLNYNAAQEAEDQVIKFSQENPALIYKAERDLKASGVEYTQDDVMRAAMTEAYALQANQATIAAAAAGAKVEFETELRPQIDTSLRKLRQIAFSALAIEQQNGNVSPESLVRLRSEFSKMKATFNKPAYVTSEQWQGTQAQIETLDQLLTTIENYDQETINKTNLEIMEPVWGALQTQARELASTDPLLAKALLDPKIDLSVYLSQNAPAVMKAASNLSAEATKYTELDFSIFEAAKTDAEAAVQPAADGTPAVPSDPVIPIDSLHDADEVSKAEEFGDVERTDVVHFAGARANLVKPGDIARPEQRDNLFAGIGQATAAISTSPTLMRQTVFSGLLNSELIEKLKVAEQYDPQGAELARARLADAIKAQANMAVTAMSGSQASSAFRMSGIGKVEFNLDANADSPFRLDAGEKAVVTTFASKWYDGDVTAMIADRGRRLPAFDRGQVEAAGLKLNLAYQQYSKLLNQAKSLKFYSDSLRKIGVDPKNFEAMMIREVIPTSAGEARGTAKNPWQIQWSDSTDADEKLFASLDVGDFFVNRDGDIEQKVR
jgi:hypothetical protein